MKRWPSVGRSYFQIIKEEMWCLGGVVNTTQIELKKTAVEPPVEGSYLAGRTSVALFLVIASQPLVLLKNEVEIFSFLVNID